MELCIARTRSKSFLTLATRAISSCLSFSHEANSFLTEEVSSLRSSSSRRVACNASSSLSSRRRSSSEGRCFSPATRVPWSGVQTHELLPRLQRQEAFQHIRLNLLRGKGCGTTWRGDGTLLEKPTRLPRRGKRDENQEQQTGSRKSWSSSGGIFLLTFKLVCFWWCCCRCRAVFSPPSQPIDRNFPCVSVSERLRLGGSGRRPRRSPRSSSLTQPIDCSFLKWPRTS